MANDPQSWAELEAVLQTRSESDHGSAQLREFIALAERRFQREVFCPERETVADLTIDAEEADLPADLWAIRALHLDTDPRAVLEVMTLAELRNSHSAAATGRPRNYAIRGERIVFGPAPDSSYVGKLSYTRTIPALGDDQATNWLLTDHPDLYLAACLVEAFSHDEDERNALFWTARYRDALESVNRSGRHRTTGSAPIRIRPPVVV